MFYVSENHQNSNDNREHRLIAHALAWVEPFLLSGIGSASDADRQNIHAFFVYY